MAMVLAPLAPDMFECIGGIHLNGNSWDPILMERQKGISLAKPSLSAAMGPLWPLGLLATMTMVLPLDMFGCIGGIHLNGNSWDPILMERQNGMGLAMPSLSAAMGPLWRLGLMATMTMVVSLDMFECIGGIRL